MKKFAAIMLASVMAVGTLAGCGSSSSKDNSGNNSGNGGSAVEESQDTTSGKSGKITIFQNKTEIYDNLVELAKVYKEETGVDVEIWQISGDDYYQSLKTYMSSESGPSIFTVESATEIAEMQAYMEDLGSLSVIAKENKDLVAKNDAGAIIGIPTTAEGFGLVYNKNLIKPDEINSMDDLTALIASNASDGIATVGLSQEDYFLIGHILNTPFALQSDPADFCNKVYNGEVNIADVSEFKQFGQLFEAIRANQQNPLEVTYDSSVGNLATGKTASIHQGNWVYGMFADYELDFDLGLMGLPINGNKKIAVGVPAVWAVNADADDNEKALAKDFLDWLYTSETGKDYILNKFGFIPVVDGMTSDKLDPISQAVSDAITNDNIIPWTFNESWPAGVVSTYLKANAEEFFSNSSMTTDEFLRALNDSFVQAANE